jgi:hypothetical protein
MLKISWIDKGKCEVTNKIFETLIVLPWDFCKITDEGFLGYANNKVEYFSNDAKSYWSRNYLLHHDIDYKDSVFTFPEKLVIRQNDKFVKIDNVVQLHKSGKLVFTWSANSKLKEIEAVFKKNINLRLVPSEGYYEYTYINGAAKIGEIEKHKNSNIFKSENIIVSLNLIGFVVIDTSTNTIVWNYDYSDLGKGQVHSPRFLPNGNIIFLLNESLEVGFSKIIELDPVSKKVVWSFQKNIPFEFYNEQFGSVLPTGANSFLVTHNTKGSKAFKINKVDKNVLWDWSSPNTAPAIYRMEEVPSDHVIRKPFYSFFRNSQADDTFEYF